MSAAPERLDVRIRGRVQGVGFRYFAWRAATELDLRGWVRNASDGSVEGRAEGPRAALETFLDRLREGPAGASVDRADADWGPASGDLGPFAIRSGGHQGD